MPFGAEKLELCVYPMVKNFYDTFISFDTIHERDGHTDTHTQTQTPHDARQLMTHYLKKIINFFDSRSALKFDIRTALQ